MLSRYLAGELPPSESAAIEKHLTGCPACAAELKELQKLDRLLDLWQPEPAPDHFWEAVLAQVAQNTLPQSDPTQSMGRKQYGLPAPVKPPGMLLLRDLLIAAAVSLALFWSSGDWFEKGQMADYGNLINGMTSTYTSTVETFLERTTGATEEYTRMIFMEEMKQR